MSGCNFLDGRVTLVSGCCLEILAALPACSVDSIVTDPPYGFEFMAKDWGRVSAKPRGRTSLMAVSAATIEHKNDTPQHRAAVKQPAFLLRCHKCNGNSSGAWGRCKCDVPDFRSRSDLGHSLQHWHGMWAARCFHVLKPGGHALAFSSTKTYHRLACAIEDAGFEIRDQIGWAYATGFPKSRNLGDGWGTALKPAWEPICVARKPPIGAIAVNRQQYGTGGVNVDACRVGGKWPGNIIHDDSSDIHRVLNTSARLFYAAKADAEDRLGSKHPTVKPLDLMQWLVRLVTPKGGTVLDPFAGTGTTGEAAWREGMRAILIERDSEYQADIARRMELAMMPTKRSAVAASKNKLEKPEDLPLFTQRDG